MTSFCGLLFAFLLGLFFILGALIVRSSANGKLLRQISVSVACGAMCALIFVDLLPEALEKLEGHRLTVLPLGVCCGLGLLELLDRLIPDHDEARGFEHNCSEANVTHIGIMSTVAVGLHNLMEGMAVYSVTTASARAGALMALGVGLHNIPMGMIIYATLRRAGYLTKRALFLCVFLSTFAGALLMRSVWHLTSDLVTGGLIAGTLGMLVFIIVFELVPHLMHARNKPLSIAGILAGMACVLASAFLE